MTQSFRDDLHVDASSKHVGSGRMSAIVKADGIESVCFHAGFEPLGDRFGSQHMPKLINEKEIVWVIPQRASAEPFFVLVSPMLTKDGDGFVVQVDEPFPRLRLRRLAESGLWDREEPGIS